MFEKIVNVIVKSKEGLSPDQLTPSTDFYIDLGWTSMDMMSCVMDVEDAAGRDIPDDKLDSIHTLGDLVAALEG